MIMSSQTECYSKKARRGTSQGGVLSPALWNLMLDDGLRANYPNTVELRAYADGVMIYATGKNVEIMKIDIEVAQDWFIRVENHLIKLGYGSENFNIFICVHI